MLIYYNYFYPFNNPEDTQIYVINGFTFTLFNHYPANVENMASSL